jgi:hypothetical protein
MTNLGPPFEAYYLPHLSQLGAQRALIAIEGEALTVRRQKDGDLIFSSPIDRLRIGTVRYWHLTLLASDEASVRIMFSDPLAMTAAGTRSIALNGTARAVNASEGGHPGHAWLRALPSTTGATLDPRMIDPAQRTSDEIQTWVGSAIVAFFLAVGVLAAVSVAGGLDEDSVGIGVVLLLATWVLGTIGLQRLLRGWARRQLEKPVETP